MAETGSATRASRFSLSADFPNDVPIMNSRGKNTFLAQALENSVIPWVERDGMNRVFTALPEWKSKMNLPEGMTVTRTSLLGSSKPIRGKRYYGGSTMVAAKWPEDDLHSARTPKLCFIMSGSILFRVADYLLHCKPGHGLLLPPGVPFANGNFSDASQSKPYQCDLLQIMPYHGGVVCWQSQHRHDESRKHHCFEETYSIPRSRVSFYLDQLTREATSPHPHGQIVCDSLLKIIIVLLQREIQQLPVIITGTVQRGQIAPSVGQQEYSMAQAQEYIDGNLRESLSIDRVARFVCMSRTTFTQQFRAHTGKTFAEYVIDRRFEEAKNILSGTDLAVRHVGQLVGLRPNRMRVLFQERTGCSPTVFRHQQRKPIP